jgi:hypothetical protein
MEKKVSAVFTDKEGNQCTVTYGFIPGTGVRVILTFDKTVDGKIKESRAYSKAWFYFRCLGKVAEIADVIKENEKEA